MFGPTSKRNILYIYDARFLIYVSWDVCDRWKNVSRHTNSDEQPGQLFVSSPPICAGHIIIFKVSIL